MGPFHLKNKDGVDFRYFRKCRHFENILCELGAVHYSRLPIFIFTRFWEIRKFLTNWLRESPCIDPTYSPLLFFIFSTLRVLVFSSFFQQGTKDRVFLFSTFTCSRTKSKKYLYLICSHSQIEICTRTRSTFILLLLIYLFLSVTRQSRFIQSVIIERTHRFL
jgi:hypothetical protein